MVIYTGSTPQMRKVGLIFSAVFFVFIATGIGYAGTMTFGSPEVETIIQNGPPSSKINLVFLSEGYRSSEMTKYAQDVQGTVNFLFNTEPYKSYQTAFNVYKVNVISTGSGSDPAPGNNAVDTAFDSYYTGSTYLWTNTTNANTARAKAGTPSNLTNTIILVNYSRFGGSATVNRITGTSICYTGTYRNTTVVHEMGHSLGYLRDEYQRQGGGAYTGPEFDAVNVTINNNRSTIKWRQYLGVESVDIFLGGATYNAGVYRPVYSNCIMRNGALTTFCIVCRNGIIPIISPYAGGGGGGGGGGTNPTLTAPSNLTATYSTLLQTVYLSWTDNSTAEDGFQLERRTGIDGTYLTIAQVSTPITSYSDSTTVPPNTYYYRVCAYNSTGNSAYSNELKVNTGQPEGAPSYLQAEGVSPYQINLSWQDNSNNEDFFTIQRNPSITDAWVSIAAVPENVTVYSNTGLTPSTPYRYRIRVYNNLGYGLWSEEASATTTALPTTVPYAPYLTANPSSATQIDLTWIDSSDNEFGFRIERRTNSTSYAQIAELPYANITSYSDTTVQPSTTPITYYYRLRAYNNIGNSGYSNEAIVSPLVPNAPSALTATAVSPSQINLSWRDNSNNEEGFSIERRTSAVTYAQIAIVPANTVSYADSGLTSTTTYYYTLQGYTTTGGNSVYSNETTATTPATATSTPAAPTSLTGTAVTDFINLLWRDNAYNEDGFKIERRRTGTTTFEQISLVDLNNTTSYSDIDILPSTNYDYRVRTYNTRGNSITYTNIATVKALAADASGSSGSGSKESKLFRSCGYLGIEVFILLGLIRLMKRKHR